MQKQRLIFSVSVLYAFAIPVLSAAEPPIEKIIDGTTVSEADYPYVARLTAFGELVCTGTLITPRHVLTAAHCFFDERNRRALGDTDISARIGGAEYGSTRVVIHPAYLSRNSACVEGETDAAVIELTGDVPGVAPIALLSTPVPLGASLLLAGYGTQGTGFNGEDGTIPPVGFINVGSTVVEGFGEDPSFPNLNSTYFFWNFDSGEANTASGDSGGPAFYSVGPQILLAGITCGGFGNAEIGTISFDTRADLMKAWVDSITGTTPADIPAGFAAVPNLNAVAGHPFTYTVQLTGTQPVSLEATGLPDGLQLSGSVISGTPTQAGSTRVLLTAGNQFGSTPAQFDIVVTSFDGSLAIKKALLQFDYVAGARDFLDITGTITVGGGFKPKNARVLVQIGRFTKEFTLRADGLSKGSPISFFDLEGPMKSGKFKKPSVKFFITLERVAIFDELATLGFPNSENASAGQEVPLPVSVTINGVTLSSTRILSFRPGDARWRVKP